MQFKKTVLASAVLSLLPVTHGAFAQDGAGVLEEVVVTGTRKEGLAPTETLAPVDVIGGATLKNQASFDLTESLTKVSPALNTQRFPIADGTAFVRPVTLRNLSPDHTLVLVNGTRRHRSALVNLQLAPLGTVNQGSQAVDFAAFPSAAIKRVEILRDGASAQYGSDAIAGVVNVILNDADEGFNVSAQYGEYDEGDGERMTVSANAGLSLGGNGFLNLTGEFADSDITSRGNARPDAVGPAGSIPYGGLGQRWGDPEIEAYKFFANSGYDLNENTEVYGTASYMYNETLGGFFYRGPVLPGDGNIANPARTTLQTDNDGDGQPDAASASLVADLVAGGFDPADYLTASASSPSGFVLRNPIHTLFPGGYSPIFGSEITDMEFVGGFRGEMVEHDLSYDVRLRYGSNEVAYTLDDSINPSLGRLSPTSFEPGTLTQEESSLNADFVKTFDDSPLNLGFGFEVRRETYEIEAGDAASIEVGPTFAQFGVGSDGFQGFFPDTTGEWDSDSWAVYFDAETDITDQLSVAAAMRYEDYEEFGDNLDYKFSARYDITDSFAVRATTNTGFRAPSPGQVNTLNVTTTADSSGNLIPSGTYPVGNPVAVVLGSQPLESEESNSHSLGLVWTPGNRTEVTVDYYNIRIKDRLALASATVSQANVNALNAMDYPNASLLLDSNANFFVNGFDTEVSGVDVAVNHWCDVMGGTLNTNLSYNHNNQKIGDINNAAINGGRVYDLENQVPEDSAVLSLDFAKGGFNGLVRLNYYGEWSTTPGLFSATQDGTDPANYGETVLVDAEVRYTFADHYTVALGGENIFDEYPDDEQDGTLQFLGAQYAVTSPFGFNGAFWYARVSASF